MGFVNKDDGKWNNHEWNWPAEADGPARKKAFHVETINDRARKDANLTSLTAPQTIEEFISPELKAGNAKVIRQSNLKFKKKLTPSRVRNKIYNNLKFSEANMVMYINSLNLNVFNPDEQFIFEKISFEDKSDEELINEYNTIVNNYNKKYFDPGIQEYTDGNGNIVTGTIKTIMQSKSSPVFPTQEEYIEQNRLTGRKAAYKKLLEKRGISING